MVNEVSWRIGEQADYYGGGDNQESVAVSDRRQWLPGRGGVETLSYDHQPRDTRTPEVKLSIYYPEQSIYFEYPITEETPPLAGEGATKWQDAAHLTVYLGFISSPRPHH